MSKVSREAIVPYSCQQMYELVADIDSYSRFLPWCRGVSVEQIADDCVRATLQISHQGMDLSFTTVNRNTTGQRVEMTLADGPFKSLDGCWSFTPLGDAGCRVGFTIDFEFTAPLYRMLAGRFFSKVVMSMMDAFLARAETVYG